MRFFFLAVILLTSACGSDFASGFGEGFEDGANMKTPAPTPEPTPATPAEQAEAIIREIYTGDTNRDLPRLTMVDVREGPEGLVVEVSFAADDNFSMGFIRGGIENRMQQAAEAIYTTDLDVAVLDQTATFSLIDNLGNEAEEPVYRTLLWADIGEQINWENAPILDWTTLWEVPLMHPELREE